MIAGLSLACPKPYDCSALIVLSSFRPHPSEVAFPHILQVLEVQPRYPV